MSKRRCVLNCPPTENGEDYLFRFPVDFHLCMKWVQSTSDPNLWNDFEYGGAFPFIDKYICSNHFLDIDYAVFGNKQLGLRKDAIPFCANIKTEPVHEVNGVEFLETENGQIDQRFLPLIATKEDEADKRNYECKEYLQKLTIKSEPLEVDVSELPKPEPPKEYNNILQYSRHSPNDLPASTFENVSHLDQIKKKSKAAYRAEERRNETPEKRSDRLEKNRIRVSNKRQNESHDQTLTRKIKCAERASVKRANETEEERKLRLEKGRVRAQERRQNMSSEERAAWRERNRIQTRERRQQEDDIKKMIRRYNNAVRASLKRSQETEQQKMERRYKDAKRAAERRMNESSEEREERLRKDRERIQAKRSKMRFKLTTLEEPDEKEQLLSILKTVNHHMDLQYGNVSDLKQAIKDSHPQLSSDFIENTVKDILDESNHSEYSTKSETIQHEHVDQSLTGEPE